MITRYSEALKQKWRGVKPLSGALFVSFLVGMLGYLIWIRPEFAKLTALRLSNRELVAQLSQSRQAMSARLHEESQLVETASAFTGPMLSLLSRSPLTHPEKVSFPVRFGAGAKRVIKIETTLTEQKWQDLIRWWMKDGTSLRLMQFHLKEIRQGDLHLMAQFSWQPLTTESRADGQSSKALPLLFCSSGGYHSVGQAAVSLSQMAWRGSIVQAGKRLAILELPNQETILVQEGQKIGQENAIIHAITAERVEVVLSDKQHYLIS